MQIQNVTAGTLIHFKTFSVSVSSVEKTPNGRTISGRTANGAQWSTWIPDAESDQTIGLE